MKITTVQMIDLYDWDKLVKETYGRTYSLQQQDGCCERGLKYITVPNIHAYDFKNDRVPEIINGDEMGVSFKAWLERDPNASLNPTDNELDACNYFYYDEDRSKWCASKSHIDLFYKRNFYPNIDMIANDLHAKGLLPAGEYIINIDW